MSGSEYFITDGVLITYKNDNMSLSCSAKMVIKSGIVIDISYKGMPRVSGDEWLIFYKNQKVNSRLTIQTVKKILEYNGKQDVKSFFQHKVFEKDNFNNLINSNTII